MKKRRLISFLLALIMCLSLCACGGDRDDDRDHDRDDDRESSGGLPSWLTPGGSEGREETGGEEGGGAVLISDALDLADCEPERDIKAFQDIASFLGRRIETWEETYRKIILTEEDGAAVMEYIRLLIEEFDYELVGVLNVDFNAEDPFGGRFLDGTWEVALALSTVDTGREMTGREVNLPCDIDLYCSNGVLKMWFTDLFHTEDYGFRPSGYEGDRFNEVYGDRALDAYYLENGRYRNGSDGALSVEAGTHGEAIIIINGEEVLHSTNAGVGVEIYADYACDDYSIGIYDFLDGTESEQIRVAIHKSLSGGEVYTLSDALGVRCAGPIYVQLFRLGDTGGVGSTTEPTGRAAMNACTVRVLQWDEVECVVYIAMDVVYELEPMTVEILAAMPAYGSLWGDSFKESEAITLKVGESLELNYDGPYVFMPNYETYEWNISSGQGAAISGYGDTCTVTGVSAGEIIIKCVYSYGTDEPDVLTGIPRNENHTKTEIYYIKVVP